MAGQIPTKGQTATGPKTATPKKTVAKAPGKAVAKVTKPEDKSDFTPTAAKKLTEGINKDLGSAFDKVIKAYQGRIWLTKGYDYKSWDEYVDKQHGGVALALPREKKKEAIQSLAAAGLSSRAIASATGVSHATAARHSNKVTDPAPVSNETPDVIDAEVIDIADGGQARTVQGQDGKSYTVTPNAPKEPVVINIVSAARTLGKDLENVRIRLDSLFSREDYEANKVDVQGTLETSVGDLIDTIVEEFADLVRERAPEGEPEPVV